MSETRPEWKHKISEADARWFWGHHVTRILHQWEYTSEDSSRHWLELHTGAKQDAGKIKLVDVDFFSRGFFEFRPYHAGLIRPTYQGEQAIKTIQDIDAWEKANKRDRAEYERLKRKFGENP